MASNSDAERPAARAGIDKLSLAIEVGKYYQAGAKPDWNELAKKLRSASGQSVQKTWTNLLKSHVTVPKATGPLEPNSSKVTKSKAKPRAKASPKTKVPKKKFANKPKKVVAVKAEDPDEMQEDDNDDDDDDDDDDESTKQEHDDEADGIDSE